MADNIKERLATDETLKHLVQGVDAIATALSSAGDAADLNWKNVQNIVRTGMGPKVFPVGTQFRVEKETSLSATLGAHTGITDVAVNEETFLAHIAHAGTGLHEFRFDGAAWIYHGNPVQLSTYGLTVTGTPADGDEIIVTEALTEIVWDVVGHRKTDDGVSEFSTASTYAVGALVTKNGYVWACSTAVTTAGAWNAANWQKLYRAGEYRMTLLMHDVWYNRPFDASEALIAVPEALGAGTYHFTYGEETYQFTLTDDVPAGSMMRCGYPSTGTDLDSQTLSVYADGKATTAAQTATIITGDGGTDLGTVGDANTDGGKLNNMTRMQYGSNNYKESAIRQWLNSGAKAGEWWAQQHAHDQAVAYANEAGFLHGMDADFLDVVQETAVLCGTNSTWERAGWETNKPYVLADRFFLPSRPEVGLGAESMNQGSVLEYYDGAKNVDRIKRDFGSTARVWWLRSPYPSNAYIVRGVVSDGSLYRYNASGGLSAAAACEIG